MEIETGIKRVNIKKLILIRNAWRELWKSNYAVMCFVLSCSKDLSSLRADGDDTVQQTFPSSLHEGIIVC